MSELCIGEIAALATTVLWTLSSLVWTATGKRIGALAVSFIRVMIVSLVLALYGRAVRGLWLPTDVSPRTWLVLAGSGFVWFFLSDLCLFKSFLLLGTRRALMLMSLTPPLAALLSWLCIGDELRLVAWVAMGITLVGVLWVISEQPENEEHPTARQHRLRGAMLAAFSAAMQAVAIVLSKEGAAQCDAMAATTIAMLGALSGYLLFTTFTRRWPNVWAARRQPRVLALLAVGVLVGPLAGVALNMVALRHAPAGVVATIVATMPVLILPFSVLLHREKITLRAVAGAVVAVVGVALLTL